jgi:hypothetical protein
MEAKRPDDQPAPLRLALELRGDGAGVAGSLRDELGARHPFTGWLGLLTLLEAARLRSRDARPGPPPSSSDEPRQSARSQLHLYPQDT